MAVFEQQGFLNMDILAGIDVTGAQSLLLRAYSPSGAHKSFVPILQGTDAVRYTFMSGDIDESGSWTFQLEVTISGQVKYGRIFREEFEKRLVDY